MVLWIAPIKENVEKYNNLYEDVKALRDYFTTEKTGIMKKLFAQRTRRKAIN